MDKKEALEVLSDGHTIISVEYAKKVCEAVGVPFAEHLVHRYKSDRPITHKGLTMKEGKENTEGVYTLLLSSYVAQVLGVYGQAGNFIGQAYAREIAKVLK